MTRRHNQHRVPEPRNRERSEQMASSAVDRIISGSVHQVQPPHSLLAAGGLPRVFGSRWFAILVLVTAVLASYSNSFRCPFVFDDHRAIADNPTIRQPWPIGKPLCPPSHGETVSGRPVLNLSFALNYAVSGCDVGGYHVTNLAIHLVAALLLFGIVRRTATKFSGLRPELTTAQAATSIALAVALLWAVHPLQTESVTYIVQRAESLMGLFYLLTLYCFLRGVGSGRAILWYAGSVLACLLGMATKEVMVSAPLVVLLYDRTFLAGSFREAWRRRWGYYLALAATWLLLAWLVVRDGTAASILWRAHGTHAVLHLVDVPGYPAGRDCALSATGGLALGAVPGLWLAAGGDGGRSAFSGDSRRMPARPDGMGGGQATGMGVPGGLVLSDTCPNIEFHARSRAAAFEHRMYLPLAAVVSGVIVGACLAGEWLARRGIVPRTALQVAGRWIAVWRSRARDRRLPAQRRLPKRSGNLAGHGCQSSAQCPGPRQSRPRVGWPRTGRGGHGLLPEGPGNQAQPGGGLCNLGLALAGRGQIEEAIAYYRKALEIEPNFIEAHNNLGIALADRGEVVEAIQHYKVVIDLASARNDNDLADVIRCESCSSSHVFLAAKRHKAGIRYPFSPSPFLIKWDTTETGLTGW